MKKRAQDGALIHERFPCREGEPATWPGLGEAPDSIRTNVNKYHGKLVIPGEYPVIDPDTPGTYQSFAETPEQREERFRKERKESFQALITAIQGERGTKGWDEYYVLRIQLRDSSGNNVNGRFAELVVTKEDLGDDDADSSDDGGDDHTTLGSHSKSLTMYDVYNHSKVKKRVRKLSRSDGNKILGETHELILTYRNNRDDSLYRQFLIDELKKRVPIWKKEFFTDSSHWVSETP